MAWVEDSWRNFQRGLDAAATSMAQGAHALVPVGTWTMATRDAGSRAAPAAPAAPRPCEARGVSA